VWAKCEHLNPGGSLKDRIALAMIERAEHQGRLRPGESTVVEATSGNTGVGLAMVCAAKAYRLTLVMPDGSSQERIQLLRSYGAEVLLTPAELRMGGAVARVRELVAQAPATVYCPDQFTNPANVDVHRRTTGPEIVAALGDVDVRAFVVGVGTGGTLSGVGQVLKERFPHCRVVAVEPESSAVLSGGAPGSHRIVGIGVGFVPKVLDRGIIDEVRTVTDRQAAATRALLARQEGLLVGMSAGAAVHTALNVALELGRANAGGGREGVVVTILCDTGERYFDPYFEVDP
jgi:cysteine synthase A